jgi:hypothetical protein
MKTKLLLSLLLIAFNAFSQGNPSTDGSFVSGASGSVDLTLRTLTSGTPTTRVTILNSSGNVGIGFSSPSQKLSVNGNIQASGQVYAQGGQMGTNTSQDLSLRTNSTERILILNSNGNVGIATASGSITEKLSVTGNFLLTGNVLSGGNVQSTGGLYTVNHASNNFVLRLNSTDRFTVLNSSGNVGIGVTPTEKLHVSGNILSTGNFTGVNFVSSGNVSTTTGTMSTSSGNIFTTSGNVYTSSGNLGVGTASPSQKLHLDGGDFLFNDATPVLYTGTGASELNRYLVLMNSSGTTSTSGLKAGGVVIADDAAYANPGKNDLIVKGKVFIGQATTTNANSYDLGVKGKIGAKDLQLETSSWSDYVFAEDYKLPSLAEVERYINENKHLEGVPSEAEVKANGYSVNEMDVVLLKKVEELTLYVIEQQKQIEELKQQLDKKSRKRKKN